MSQIAGFRRVLAARFRSRSLLDAAVATVTFIVTLVLLVHGGRGNPIHVGLRNLDLVGVVLAACSTLPVIGWRRFPLSAFVTTSIATILLVGLDYRLGFTVGPTVALYLLSKSVGTESHRSRRLPLTVVIAVLAAYLATLVVVREAFPNDALIHTGLTWAVAWFAGERSRLRREQLVELRERAVRVEQAAERERQLAVVEERARIARDLHDCAGHAINVIAVRAGAARLRHQHEPDRSLPALAAIEDLARQTAVELDHIVGTLRERGTEPDVIEPPIGLVSLDTLIAHHRTTGLAITFDTVGSPRPLVSIVDQAGYRILQEALTNAARYGTGGVRVDLTYGDEALDIVVTNPTNDANRAARPGGGHGLIGMRERAALAGGRLDVESTHDRFKLHARIPYGGGAP